MIIKKQRLDQILFNRNLAESKSKAQAMIMAGQVFVEGIKINKSGFNINQDSLIEIKNLGPEWVSRGAIKLIKALDAHNIQIRDKICIDLGSSTGGFTDVLIQRGAKKVPQHVIHVNFVTQCLPFVCVRGNSCGVENSHPLHSSIVS